MLKQFILIFIFSLWPYSIFSQNAVAPLPSGFETIQLGLSLDAVKTELANNRNFAYRGEPDVSMLQQPNSQAIEVTGAGFIQKGYFLFFNDQLHTIILELRGDRLDYPTLLSTLTQKYGEVTNLSNTVAQWQNDTVKLSLERPLVLKYTNLALFAALQEASQIDQNTIAILREDFLNSL